MPSAFEILKERGFVSQVTDEEAVKGAFEDEVVTCYIGFDPTSDDLHVGSLVQIMLLHWLQEFGHNTIVLMGGGTTLVGDPSGKDETRKIIKKNQIDNNIKKSRNGSP